MPTYQYACTSCGERLEAVQKFTDEPLTTCPSCQGSLRKVFSAVGVVFKGSGFYRTDSREGGKRTSSLPAANTSDSAKSESTTSTSSGDAASSTPSPSSSPAPSSSGSAPAAKPAPSTGGGSNATKVA